MTRFGYVMVTYFSVMGFAAASFVPTLPRLVWNASASVPIGFYDLERPSPLQVGDLVAVMPDMPLADFMVGRGYIGRGVPLLKHIAALPGQRICRDGLVIRIDGAPVAEARERDTLGRRLPVWQGCRTVGDGDVFLLNREAGDSLDGRYFGAVPASWIVGRAIPLWTDERGSGRFTWRAEERPPSFPAPQTRSIP